MHCLKNFVMFYELFAEDLVESAETTNNQEEEKDNNSDDVNEYFGTYKVEGTEVENQKQHSGNMSVTKGLENEGKVIWVRFTFHFY